MILASPIWLPNTVFTVLFIVLFTYFDILGANRLATGAQQIDCNTFNTTSMLNAYACLFLHSRFGKQLSRRQHQHLQDMLIHPNTDCVCVVVQDQVG